MKNMSSQTVLVLGAGKSGIAAATCLIRLGAHVILNDQNTNLIENDIKSRFRNLGKPDVIIGEVADLALEKVDLCVISPGISLEMPFVKKIKSKGIPIWGEIELAYNVGQGRIVAITGTNGKTTTTALTGEILSAYYPQVEVVGNIGSPYTLSALDEDDDTVTVAEVSSFQLETTDRFCPDVSAILNITPDHMDRHHTMENYLEIKMKIAKNQDKDQPIVLNYEDPLLLSCAPKLKNRVVWFSSAHKLVDGVYLDDGDIVYSKNGKTVKVMSTKDTSLVGIHNMENIMAAVAISIEMGVPFDIIKSATQRFKAVEHRMEYVDAIEGVIYYNDSKGTNTDASIKAIQAMDNPTILIAGGYDKNADFNDFVDAFGEKIKELVLIGETAEKIADTAKKHGFVNIKFADTLKKAVELCKNDAKKGDAVLLSPACASWDMFENYEQRGDMFKEYVKELNVAR